MASQHLKIKSKTGLFSAIGHLEKLITALKEGTILISHKRKSILLKPQASIGIDLYAEVESDGIVSREKLGLKLKWEISEAWRHEEKKFTIVRPTASNPVYQDLNETIDVILPVVTESETPALSGAALPSGASPQVLFTTTKNSGGNAMRRFAASTTRQAPNRRAGDRKALPAPGARPSTPTVKKSRDPM